MKFEYLVPRTVAEAIGLLRQYGGQAKVIAGGTDLMSGMRQKLTRLRGVKYLVDIANISGLGSLREEQGQLGIGALATLRTLERSPLMREKCSLVAQAASQVGSVAIRNAATLGGNLCQETKCLHYAGIYRWGPAPCYHGGGAVCYAVSGAGSCQAMATNELAPALICLDAEARVAGSDGERIIPMEDFFIEPGDTSLAANEILTEVKFSSPSSGRRVAYLKHTYMGIPGIAVVGVAAVLVVDGVICQDARIAFIGGSTKPLRAHKAEEVLRGDRLSDAVISRCGDVAARDAHPVSDGRASAQYRRSMVKVLTRRVITQAAADRGIQG